ncbi:CbbQ/NirQ/NorQ/GpvN family protein [Marinobacter lacisalsi]|uniref:CbbQ/NirQ/NorQ/GpvN family protein n=1 Tax=Marinobacter lacisalsi TaxID=475979 RepID=A0ABV8QHP0_9GAMM
MTFYQPVGHEVELFRTAADNGLPVLIKGPTGCGKTRFVRYMAEQLDRPVYTVACHDDLTAADLVGRHLIGPEGTYWQDGPLTRAVREGGICYLDEVVEARKDTTVVLHPLADDRRELPIERTGEVLTAAPGFMLVVSYNPGYQSLLKGMKPSTRQRFVSLSFDYPQADMEQTIVMEESGCNRDLAAQLVSLAQSVRNLKDHDLEEAASTRLLIHTAHLIKAGVPVARACRAGMIEPLSDDEATVNALMEVVYAVFGRPEQSQ